VTTSTDNTPLLQLEGIWKSYPGVVALKDVSLSVLPGEIHALLGENGAGKSTLVGVAAGEVAPGAGTITIGGTTSDRLTPSEARRNRLAIVHQHPALLPDMTVAENMALAAPPGGASADWMREQLDRVGVRVALSARLDELTVAQRHLIELAKAFGLDPKVLILDEPTAPLGAEMVATLFEQVRAAAARGTGVVYITHRLPEVRQIATRVTVMRDGSIRGSAPTDQMSDDEMISLIVGRSLETTFPDKNAVAAGEDSLVVTDLSNSSFADVALSVHAGEIVGLAGIVGNGQSEVLRALAGLEPATGDVTLAGAPLQLGNPKGARAAGVAYLPADRHSEGLLMSLSVRENAALSALPKFSHSGVVRRRQEIDAVNRQREALAIRTPSIETTVEALSGGNQQKVVLARALLSQPSLVLADEPTQGVDAGTRVEIYRILREIANAGIPVLIVSSDGLELEGLCDRVFVMSRGNVVGELAGDEVTEERIARTIVTATAHRREAGSRKADEAEAAAAAEEAVPMNVAALGVTRADRLRSFAKGDYMPSLILALAIVLLGAYTVGQNDRFTASFNMTSLMTLLAALAFISFGQLIVVMTAGIDISVGPLAGLIAVIASFFLSENNSASRVVIGLLIMVGVALAVGVINGSLVRFGRFTPVAATLTMYIALQGVSKLLRPFQGGYIKTGITDVVQTKLGIIPVALIIAVCMAILLEYCLRYTRWGLALRAAGSNEDSARRLGVRIDRTIVGAYVASALLTFLGGIMLMAQIGVGDPTQGVTYTLASITAVVLGGASLFGGRGSFIATLLGAALLQEIINATTFLNLTQAWQFWFQGLFVLAAAVIYTLARRRGQVA
jgi:ABC-type sugar transport system ATPase subunit/ribose/xylose/arabinose/galactoside ABC-type transport system permease subunit